MLGKKIVIVDDDETIRKTFFLLLNKKYRVYLAGRAKEALDRFGRAEVDLIIVDFKLPDLDGLELVSRFRKKGYEGDVILISAFPDLIELKELDRLRIGSFFTKPLDLNAFNRSISRLMDSRASLEKQA